MIIIHRYQCYYNYYIIIVKHFVTFLKNGQRVQTFKADKQMIDCVIPKLNDYSIESDVDCIRHLVLHAPCWLVRVLQLMWHDLSKTCKPLLTKKKAPKSCVVLMCQEERQRSTWDSALYSFLWIHPAVLKFSVIFCDILHCHLYAAVWNW